MCSPKKKCMDLGKKCRLGDFARIILSCLAVLVCMFNLWSLTKGTEHILLQLAVAIEKENIVIVMTSM